jgi:hypothetical protein
MEIEKSSRHQHIIGKFGEYMLCNWLSRSRFEVAIVDHTGLDLVAFNPRTEQRIGITVKSRTRSIGTETTSVNLFSYRKGKDDRQRLLEACYSFGCEPWIAIYVETKNFADLYLTSLDNYDKRYRTKVGRAVDTWGMASKHRTLYGEDKEVKHIKIDFHQQNWDWPPR